MHENVDVVVVGSSISGLMTAAWLKTKIETLSVVVIGPPVGEERRPIVGESLVEPAVLFFRELGLGPYLDERHEIKYGLTFYHKLSPRDPFDRRYTVHAPSEKLHHLSRQLHRPAFDCELARLAASRGVRFVEGRVRDFTVGEDNAQHTVRGEGFSFSSRWLVDTTGRKRIIGRTVTKYERPELQRSAFWFRIRGFDPLLPTLQLSERRPVDYPLWKSTHHFMGQGNWIWGIPLKDDSGEPVLSMGITWRPDVFPADIRSIDDFVRWADAEHPAIADMVRSGEVLDTQRYRNYLYRAEQIYSPDGWFLIGDAARSVDPLYSTGLSMTAIQVEQVGELIRRELAGAPVPADGVAALGGLWMTLADIRQDDITDQYKTMDQPLQACLRRYWNLCAWFNALLPLWFNGYFVDPDAAVVLKRMFEASRPGSRAAWRLFGQAAAAAGPELEQADFDRLVDFDWLINRSFDCAPEHLPRTISRLPWKRACLRWNLLSMSGWQHLPGQAPHLLRELGTAALSRTLLFRLPALQGARRHLTLQPGPDGTLQPADTVLP